MIRKMIDRMRTMVDSLTAKIARTVSPGAATADQEFIVRELLRWKNSPQRIMQIKGHLYYDGVHDILHRKRTVIGEGGELTEVKNLPNHRIIDNQYAKLVNQKANYLLGKPFVIEGENQVYVEAVKQVFDKHFMKTLKAAGKAMLNHGICWLYPYYNEEGAFSFRLFPGYEVLPFWKDSEHTMLEAAVRLYLVAGYEGTRATLIEKVEIYDLHGVHCFILDGSRLRPDVQGAKEHTAAHVTAADENGNLIALNWEKVPLIPLKYNECELPLLQKVKTLQDGLNLMISDFANNMQEDARNTILVLKNYDGTDLGEFRKNLATYGAVKVRYDGETKGGVETLEITVNAENYKVIMELFKKAVLENGMGYDAKDDRLSGNPNQMNIQSMYSDIDLDANDMETELQASFEEILWFVNAHLANTGQGSFAQEDLKIIFNRDILISESEAIENCKKSVGILSDETIIGMHPWVDDPQAEMERLKKQKEEAQKEMLAQYDPFGTQQQGNGADDDPDNKGDPVKGSQGGDE